MKINIKIVILILSMMSATVFSSGTVFADPPVLPGANGAPALPGFNGVQTQPAEKLKNPITAENIKDLMISIADLAIFIGTMFAVIMFFWVGFKFVMARENESEIKDAKEMFMYIVIGTAILISSKVIVQVIKSTLVDSGVVNQEFLPK